MNANGLRINGDFGPIACNYHPSFNYTQRLHACLRGITDQRVLKLA